LTDWIDEDKKKLQVEFTIVDPTKIDTADQLSKELKEASNEFSAKADSVDLKNAEDAANDKAKQVKGSIVVNDSAFEMGFAMTTDDDDVIDAYRYRQWNTSGEMTMKLQRSIFKRDKEDGKFKFDSED